MILIDRLLARAGEAKEAHVRASGVIGDFGTLAEVCLVEKLHQRSRKASRRSLKRAVAEVYGKCVATAARDRRAADIFGTTGNSGASPAGRAQDADARGIDGAARAAGPIAEPQARRVVNSSLINTATLSDAS